MASRATTLKLFFLLLSLLAFSLTAIAGDPDIISDFLLPSNLTTVDGNFFTFTGFRPLIKPSQISSTFKVNKASIVEFPALNGQSVSYAVLQFPSGSTNPPHTHPRAAELLFLLKGSLNVGFVDATNKPYTQSLQAGDIFVFPKGLVHFQQNSDPQKSAVAISAFGSANAGTVSIPNTLFTTGIDDNLLALSFKTEVSTIQQLKAGLVPKL